MTIEEKYNIVNIKGNKYYKINMNDSLKLNNSVPFYFEYKTIKIYRNSWVKLTKEIIISLDKLNPKPENKLLELKYSWSNLPFFSREPKPGFTKFKGIYLNTNHSSTKSFMNIKSILNEYGVDFSNCTLLIKKYPIAESKEVKTHYKKITKCEFSKYLSITGKSKFNIRKIFRNIERANKIIKKLNRSYDDFFLFGNEYDQFARYKNITIEKCEKIYSKKKKYNELIENYLSYLETFYFNRYFFKQLIEIGVPKKFKKTITHEINYLFNYFKNDFVTISKLYSRMSFLHSELMMHLDSLNNKNDFNILITALLNKSYEVSKHLIFPKGVKIRSNDELIYDYAKSLDIISITTVSTFIEQRQLIKLNNYSKLMSDLSNEYVQINMNMMIKKNKILISMDDINQIEKELTYYINSFSEINSESFAGYSSLPKLKYKWNKYLLLGIVRTYFSKVFEVTYKTNQYNALKFTIRNIHL